MMWHSNFIQVIGKLLRPVTLTHVTVDSVRIKHEKRQNVDTTFSLRFSYLNFSFAGDTLNIVSCQNMCTKLVT